MKSFTVGLPMITIPARIPFPRRVDLRDQALSHPLDRLSLDAELVSAKCGGRLGLTTVLI